MRKVITLAVSLMILDTNASIAETQSIPLPPVVSIKQQQKQNQSIESAIISTKNNNENEVPTQIEKKPQVSIPKKIISAPGANNIKVKIGVNASDGALYLPLASTICIFMNEINSDACRIKQYDSSVKLFTGLLNGDIDIIVTNAVSAKYVFDGNTPFENNMQNKKMRFVSSIFNDVLQIVTRSDSRIKKLDDIKNTSINISKNYTTTRIFMDNLMKIKGLTTQDFQKVSELDLNDEVSALCNGDIKVMTVVAQKFNQYLKDVTRTCDVNIVDFTKEDIELFLVDSQYVNEKIEGGTYIGIPVDVDTVATKALLVSTSDVQNQTIYHVIDILLKHLKDIKNLHGSFAQIKPQEVLSQGRVLPLHEAVDEFINQNGIVGLN
jgi:TRAP transporter TAXI family solute receptor